MDKNIMSSSLHIYIKENLIHYTNTVNCAIIYNIGDAINKIGFGLVIYNLAISKDS